MRCRAVPSLGCGQGVYIPPIMAVLGAERPKILEQFTCGVYRCPVPLALDVRQVERSPLPKCFALGLCRVLHTSKKLFVGSGGLYIPQAREAWGLMVSTAPRQFPPGCGGLYKTPTLDTWIVEVSAPLLFVCVGCRGFTTIRFYVWDFEG